MATATACREARGAPRRAPRLSRDEWPFRGSEEQAVQAPGASPFQPVRAFRMEQQACPAIKWRYSHELESSLRVLPRSTNYRSWLRRDSSVPGSFLDGFTNRTSSLRPVLLLALSPQHLKRNTCRREPRPRASKTATDSPNLPGSDSPRV